MTVNIYCTNCLCPYPDLGTPYHCLSCGGLFDYLETWKFDPARIDTTRPGIWRYFHTFGLPENSHELTLGEGNTPLIWTRLPGKNGESAIVGLKCEYINPTGSFKDRGSALITSFLLSRGIEQALEDSSGNAGASFAAYAARGGIRAKIFIPDSASGPKRNQIEAFGAELVCIPRSRSSAAEAVRKEIDAQNPITNIAYGSHAYLPVNLPGYATIAYELVDQINDMPGTVIIPVGQGGAFLGIGRGFQALVDAGSIKKVPLLVGVQAQACAPIWAIIKYGRSGQLLTSEGNTIAEGIRIRYPLRGDAVIQMVEKNGWMMLAIAEEDILVGQVELARRGFFVEPTSAVVWEAAKQVVGKVPEPIVAILTGSGLKTRE
jgi:threonine synthase